MEKIVESYLVDLWVCLGRGFDGFVDDVASTKKAGKKMESKENL